MSETDLPARKPKYWAFRVDRRQLARLDSELEAGRLRQGWGYDPRQNLLQNTFDGGSRRNLRMLQVRQGDRVLIPHLPRYGQVTIVEATQDWKEGYEFSILDGTNDYGHIFPVKRLKSFSRGNNHVRASLRSTFRNPCRFWRIDGLGADIEHVLSLSEGDLESSSRHVERWHEKIETVVRDKELREALVAEALRFNAKAEWEWILVDALQRLNPAWKVKRTGGKEESNHGTDILVKIPDLFGNGYFGIAIQVKDYAGTVDLKPLAQIRKATDYWNQKEEVKICELVLILTKANREQNSHLFEAAEKEMPVRILWAEDVKELIYRSACQYISESVSPPMSRTVQDESALEGEVADEADEA